MEVLSLKCLIDGCESIKFSGLLDGKLMAVANLSLNSRSATDDAAHLSGLFIDADYRKLGFGRKLLDAVIFVAKQEGKEIIVLQAYPANAPAISLYESLGFVYYDSDKDGLGSYYKKLA